MWINLLNSLQAAIGDIKIKKTAPVFKTFVFQWGQLKQVYTSLEYTAVERQGRSHLVGKNVGFLEKMLSGPKE